MAGEEHWEFAVTIPPGTTKANPLRTATPLPTRIVSRIAWTVPPGPSGNAGWQIGMGKVQIIPVNLNAWIVKDGDSTASELARLPNTGDWQVTGYNTGAYPHTIYVTFYASVIRPVELRPIPLGLDALQPGITSPPAHH